MYVSYNEILSKAKDSDILIVGENEYHDFKYLDTVQLRNLDYQEDQAEHYSKEILTQATTKFQSYENNMESDRFTVFGAGGSAFRIYMNSYKKIKQIEYVAPNISHIVQGKQEEYYKSKDSQDKGMLNSL